MLIFFLLNNKSYGEIQKHVKKKDFVQYIFYCSSNMCRILRDNGNGTNKTNQKLIRNKRGSSYETSFEMIKLMKYK